MKLTPTILLLILCTFSIASAENIYIPVEQPTGTPYGTLYIHVLCMHDLFSKEIILINAEGISTSLFLNPDGKYDTPLNPGHYKMILIDGNAGHREEREYDIVAGQTQTVTFIGHAVSSEPGKIEPSPTPTLKPQCHWERTCTPGHWTYELRQRFHAPWCDWVITPVWHSRECHPVWQCDPIVAE